MALLNNWSIASFSIYILSLTSSWVFGDLDNFAQAQVIQAQVIPDRTIPTEVDSDNNRDFTVNAGEQRGNNLFHSFTEFSIPNNGSVLFNNAITIENIITRVTGSSISNINGLIQSNGTANLFLVNPNGIVFGKNASLNIGGSFIATTAESLVFEDGTEFSSNLENSEPLLSVNVPLGLQFGNNPGEITNKADFSIPNLLDPTGQDQIKLGLNTPPGQTLAFLGGDITFDGGAVTASGGNVELGSVAENSFVALEPIAQGWKADYDDVSQFRDIKLDRLASVDTSGEGGGSINVWGQRINILDGSVISAATLGTINGKDIVIRATELLKIDGSDSTNQKLDLSLASVGIFVPVSSRITTDTLGKGNGGNIRLFTSKLEILNGAKLQTRTITTPNNIEGKSGRSGDILINNAKSISLRGFKPLIGVADNIQELFPIPPEAEEVIDLERIAGLTTTSSIDVIPTGNGDGGNINIITNKLELEDASTISNSPSFGSRGNGGNITINAQDSIEIYGLTISDSSFVSIITANTFGAGNAGNIELSANKLLLQDGGGITSGTISTGSGGNIILNTESIEIMGTSGNGVLSSGLGSETFSEGNAGDVIVNTESLTIANQGQITVRGLNSGTPGNLTINANSINLSDSARITAENTAAIEGGNISLKIEDSLILETNSTISTQAFNNANGGNLDIAVGFLIANPNENNDILATAVGGSGGNINIDGNGVFGIIEQSSRPPNFSNDIDASSEFGTDGTVTLEIPNFTEFQSLLARSQGFIDVNSLLKNNFCNLSRDSEYHVVGKSGMAFTVDGNLPVNDAWSDWRFFDDDRSPETSATPPEIEKTPEIKMIQGWQRDRNGRIVLTADASSITPHQPASPNYDCSGINY